MNDAVSSAWLARARIAIPLSLAVLLVIGLISGSSGLLMGKTQFTILLFLWQDVPVILAIIILSRLTLMPQPSAGYPACWMVFPLLNPWVIAAALAILCWAGHRLILHGHDLTRDEQMASFDALLFASGQLYAPIPAFWQTMAEALNQLFMLPIADRQSWVSGYLPINAAFRSILLRLGDASLTSPLFTAIGALALWRITLRLWPDDIEARAVALLLYAGSSQVILLGMTSYAMAGHLALNLVWLWLFQRGKWSHAGAIMIGFLATGLHQPIFHPLFVAPFMVALVWQRRWPLIVLYGLGYAAICIFWLSWPHLVAQAAGGAMPTVSATGDRLGIVGRILDMLRETGPVSLFLMAMNLLRFVAWQHILLVPLMAAGIWLAWRAPLVRPLTAGMGISVAAIGLLLAYQGHGWGYRYLHGMIGSACILGGYGWQALRGLWPGAKTWAWGNAANFCILIPVHLWIAAQFTAPYARASAAIDRMPAAVVVIDERAVAFGSDLAINRHDLSNRPIRLLADSLTLDQMTNLCARERVAFVGRAELAVIARAMASRAGDDTHYRALQARCTATRSNLQ